MRRNEKRREEKLWSVNVDGGEYIEIGAHRKQIYLVG